MVRLGLNPPWPTMPSVGALPTAHVKYGSEATHIDVRFSTNLRSQGMRAQDIEHSPHLFKEAKAPVLRTQDMAHTPVRISLPQWFFSSCTNIPQQNPNGRSAGVRRQEGEEKGSSEAERGEASRRPGYFSAQIPVESDAILVALITSFWGKRSMQRYGWKPLHPAGGNWLCPQQHLVHGLPCSLLVSSEMSAPFKGPRPRKMA